MNTTILTQLEKYKILRILVSMIKVSTNITTSGTAVSIPKSMGAAEKSNHRNTGGNLMNKNKVKPNAEYYLSGTFKSLESWQKVSFYMVFYLGLLFAFVVTLLALV